jgi:hypothetical protein
MRNTINHYKRCAVHHFKDGPIPFDPIDYSRLKFGDDEVAKRFGRQLAIEVFNNHRKLLTTTECVVIPSPYNFVKNAATVMTEHMVNYLNVLLARLGDFHVETSIIHRKVSYTKDYGFLDKDKRKGLLSGDVFYINKQFVEGKTLIMVDDVRITGTHEEKLIDVLSQEQMSNACIFAYYAMYRGNTPSLEAEINFAGIKCIDDYVELSLKQDHHLIVRPIKYMLAQTPQTFFRVVVEMSDRDVRQLYFACVGEGYHKLEQYQINFAILRSRFADIEG